MAKQRMADQGTTEGMTEEEAQDRFLDAVGRMAPLTGTKLGLVGSIQHLHLLPEFHDRLEKLSGLAVTMFCPSVNPNPLPAVCAFSMEVL